MYGWPKVHRKKPNRGKGWPPPRWSYRVEHCGEPTRERPLGLQRTCATVAIMMGATVVQQYRETGSAHQIKTCSQTTISKRTSPEKRPVEVLCKTHRVRRGEKGGERAKEGIYVDPNNRRVKDESPTLLPTKGLKAIQRHSKGTMPYWRNQEISRPVFRGALGCRPLGGPRYTDGYGMSRYRKDILKREQTVRKPEDARGAGSAPRRAISTEARTHGTKKKKHTEGKKSSTASQKKRGQTHRSLNSAKRYRLGASRLSTTLEKATPRTKQQRRHSIALKGLKQKRKEDATNRSCEKQ